MTNIIKNRNAASAAFGSVLDQLFPKNAAALLDDTFWGLGSPAALTVAPVNIRATAESYEVQLVAPGLRKSDFQLNIDGDTLTISYEQPNDQQAENTPAEITSQQKEESSPSKWMRREFVQPAFKRQFELDETIDRDRISARYDSGILCLTLPKKENVRPASRQININ